MDSAAIARKGEARVFLVIPYYDDPEGLNLSLQSVNLLASDRILVVDDGSPEFPAKQYCPEKVGLTPIAVVELAKNQGITKALRFGIDAIPEGFDLIARLDCGDVCSPDRFEVQREHMRKSSECALVGSWVEFVSPAREHLYTLRHPAATREIRRSMRVNSAFTHPAVMFRKSAYIDSGGYSALYPAAEDYALFMVMARKFEVANIQRVLVSCRTGDGGISTLRRRQQLKSRMKVMRETFDWHPRSIWGITRAMLQLVTPRSFTTFIRQRLG